jgi:hypothetical protein
MSNPESIVLTYYSDRVTNDPAKLDEQFLMMIDAFCINGKREITELYQDKDGSLTPGAPVWRRIWADRDKDPPGLGSAIPDLQAQVHPMRFLPDTAWRTLEDRMFFAQARGFLNHVANLKEGAPLDPYGAYQPEKMSRHLRHGLVLATHAARLQAIGAIFGNKYTSPMFVQEALYDAVRDVFGLTYYNCDEGELRRLVQTVVQGRENSFVGNLWRVARLVDEFGHDKISKEGYLQVDKEIEAQFLRDMAQVSLRPDISPSPLIQTLGQFRPYNFQGRILRE